MLQNDVYPQEYIDDWEKFNETSLPEKEGFCSYLNMDDHSDVDYKHVQRVCKDFKIRNLRKYHDLHVRCDTISLVDVFNNFLNMCLKKE